MKGASTVRVSTNGSSTEARQRKHFVERLEMAYADAKRLGDPGTGTARQWFANRSGIDKSTVSRMLNPKESEAIHSYAWGALDRLEEINELRARALKAEENTSIVLLEEAAEKARKEAARLERTIERLKELCRCPANTHDPESPPT